MIKMIKCFAIIFFLILSPHLNALSFDENSQAGTQTAILYYHPSCRHCETVINYLKQNGKALTLKDTSKAVNKSELQRLGQRGVPVLVAGSKVIVGSTPIISYLKQHPEAMH